jgi:hypothetical protein
MWIRIPVRTHAGIRATVSGHAGTHVSSIHASHVMQHLYAGVLNFFFFFLFFQREDTLNRRFLWLRFGKLTGNQRKSFFPAIVNLWV